MNMAITIRNIMLICNRVIVKQQTLLGRPFMSSFKLYENRKNEETLEESETIKDIDVEKIFIQPKVQEILKRIRHINMDKVFRTVTKPLSLPRYQFLTEEELQQQLEEARQKAEIKLQMPPVLKPKPSVTEILSYDPELQGLDNFKIVFTDITYGISDRQRLIVVRDTDGTLRKAKRGERHRMNQTYFPQNGRKHKLPIMFEDEHLDNLLQREKYEFVLDRACLQFEPDDPDYIKIIEKTYQHIDTTRSFNELRSTRHFGSMAFYFVVARKMDNLLLDMIQRKLISDAADLVRLYCIVHPDSDTAQQSVSEGDDLGIVKIFLQYDSRKKGNLELALQTYEDMQKQRHIVEEGVKSAHGHT
ncbi:28S ribosomal protein S22, mitochondrial-like isoform X3 [Limulus polyphemus]|uniref:28S ribosomal protein S22, mitochondrial-like isoform X2 n=1 Tax=Limulus polyphemus TaxID=6850 RepID=A0ABM1SAF0_LIMPO|nr:28S ribosomal protein S22, mitochondrial-like isoform X2 [Limulus polyphemus]XP_022240605.1 28S ribosomal protein S22, mitochondrial-like isoform X3 [Limulus polyphemus]